MKERAILFSAPMVRALLAGTKTQTRRILKGSLEEFEEGWSLNGDHPVSLSELPSPYGAPGDRLWVKETWGTRYDFDVCKPTMLLNPEENKHGAEIYHTAKYTEKPQLVHKWRPSLFMRRWMSRITLELTDVRVERLNEISEADAIAEGIERITHGESVFWRNYTRTERINGGEVVAFNDPSKSYRSLWQSINGAGSWDANPWVWVVEFKVITKGAAS